MRLEQAARQALEALEYKDGFLYWKSNGKRAGTTTSQGYIRIHHGENFYLAHRLIFFLHHNYLPKEIDHIDGNKSNNEIKNLRAATTIQNQQNARRRKDNVSGIKGVHLHKKTGKWCAQLKVNGKPKHLGLFSEPEAARKAVEMARQQFHGEFMNHG